VSADPVDDTPRLAKLAPTSLDDEQRSVYQAIAGGRRAQGPQLFRLVDVDGGLEGPFNAFLLQPRLGQAVQALGAAVRYDTTLSDRAREVAILVVAAGWDSAFEWYAHEALGRHAGLTDDELDAVRSGRLDELPTEYEREVASVTRLLVTQGDLGEEHYRRAVDVLGEATLFELLTVVGYYGMLAMQLRVFRVGVPSG
jgi:4-carboxymuconolactone decarboxylase